MKNLSITANTIFLILFFSITTLGQFSQHQFVSGEGGFTINLPKTPSESKERELDILEFELKGTLKNWNNVEGFFATIENYVVYSDKINISEKDKQQILDVYKNANATEMKKAGVEVSQHSYSFGKSKGFELRGTLERKTILRGFFIKNRLFILGVVKANIDSFTPIIKTLNSFQLLTKKEHIAVLISENTPESLPQKTSRESSVNDLKRKNLKGKVKAVFEEFVTVSNKERKSLEDAFFDSKGNLIKDISYMDGYPEGVTTWGWVDEMRVVKYKKIEYPSGEGPDMSGILVATLSETDANSSTSKKDNRYNTRYKTKFDKKGRIIKESTYSNTGVLFSTKKITYLPNGREITYYTGKELWFMNKTKEIFNENGDVVEAIATDEEGKDPSYEVYRYKYDSNKNWVVQEQFEKIIKNGKTILKPTFISYRKIIYFE